MSKYRSELHNNGVAIYTEEINKELFDTLEDMYDGENELNDFEYLKVIYSQLSDEVDDPDFYDMGYNEDNDDLVNILFDYAVEYNCDKSKLAIELGKYLIINEYRRFKSYNDFHKALTDALHISTNIDDEDDEYI
ncbi:hypothetical protein GEO21_22940, partial [Sphingobacterium faecium]|uniref:hypothetical protein n=1 Tax=Sphingobacterium faecium TaxID=34087 RepID=UPI001291C4AE